MGLLSGLKFVFILAVVGVLAILGTRLAKRGKGLNLLSLLIAAVLLFAVLSLSSLVVALFKFSMFLIVLVALPIFSMMYTTIRR
jgi:hypothetical protein